MTEGLEEKLEVGPEEGGIRLDKWLADTLEELEYEISRSQVQQWLDEGYVTGPRTRLKASDKVAPHESYDVSVPAPEPMVILPDEVPFDLVYQDGDVVVVNKPRGVVVHPAAGHPRGTLLNGLAARGITLSTLGGGLRPGVVHRIDKETSGLLMFARTDLAYHKLAEQLKEHSVDRIYRALVHGRLQHDVGIVDAPIGRDPRNRQRMAVTDGGKSAVTHFRVVDRYPAYTFLELRLETGRTHQIRVHMAYIDHPLAGDKTYGRRHTLDIDGQALHAMTLGFTHPRTGERLSFSSPLPEDMQRLVDGLAAGVLQ